MTVIVTYEDRPDGLIGAELLARSLAAHAPTLRMEIHSPCAEVGDRIADLPGVGWVSTDDLHGRSWNVKPEILTRALGEHPRVMWVDADIVFCGDPRPLLERIPEGTLALGTEYADPEGHAGALRARGFGLPLRRRLGESVNSGTVLADRSHLPLLRAWSALLQRADYRAAQALPLDRRPMAMVGDQDALWAALIAAEAYDGPLRFLHPGQEMLFHVGGNGFSLQQRMAVLRGAQPVLVHMPGVHKPWGFDPLPGPLRQPGAHLHAVCYELSPYFEAAQPLAPGLGDPPWLRRRTLLARLLNALFLGNVPLRGMPLALLAAATMRFRRR